MERVNKITLPPREPTKDAWKKALEYEVAYYYKRCEEADANGMRTYPPTGFEQYALV